MLSSAWNKTASKCISSSLQSVLFGAPCDNQIENTVCIGQGAWRISYMKIQWLCIFHGESCGIKNEKRFTRCSPMINETNGFLLFSSTVSPSKGSGDLLWNKQKRMIDLLTRMISRVCTKYRYFNNFGVLLAKVNYHQLRNIIRKCKYFMYRHALVNLAKNLRKIVSNNGARDTLKMFWEFLQKNIDTKCTHTRISFLFTSLKGESWFDQLIGAVMFHEDGARTRSCCLSFGVHCKVMQAKEQYKNFGEVLGVVLCGLRIASSPL